MLALADLVTGSDRILGTGCFIVFAAAVLMGALGPTRSLTRGQRGASGRDNESAAEHARRVAPAPDSIVISVAHVLCFAVPSAVVMIVTIVQV